VLLDQLQENGIAENKEVRIIHDNKRFELQRDEQRISKF
jgi:hypothetical protein